MHQKWAACIQYTGTHYRGWQRQPDCPHSVQQRVEEALSFVANRPIQVVCAGRTDAGVHATAQIVHFETECVRAARAWVLGANTQLPADISIQWARPVVSSFHARFAATARRYVYLIYNHQQRPGVLAPYVTWHLQSLDVRKMQQAAAYLVGEHDFSALRSSQCQAKHAVRHLQAFHIQRHGHMILCEVQANAFLHHMVRNIIGLLLAVGSGKRPAVWAQEVLASKDRRCAGVTAPANGLYLQAVAYPKCFQLPEAAGLKPFSLASLLLS